MSNLTGPGWQLKHAPDKRAGGINAALQNALHNDYDPKREIKHERPRHRVVQGLAAQGKSNVEIAALTGLSTETISNILRQPWARERIIGDIREVGLEELREILASEAKPSLQRLVSLRDGAESEQVQLAAADKLLDRFLGRPTQPIRDDTDLDKLKELSDAELNRISSKGGGTVTGTTPGASELP